MALNTEHVYVNKFYAHLREAINASQTTITIYPEEITTLLSGWKANCWLYLCIVDNEGHLEIVKMTGLSVSTMTVERGQGGTSARSWEAGSLIACRITAENANRWLQKGVNRQGAYNPNYVLTGAYTGEKYYQTGPDALQRRWWINVTGDKWRLLTGDVFGSEYYDSWGWIFDPPGWVLVSSQITNGSLISACAFNGKLYCGAQLFNALYEWNGTDDLTLVASTVANGTISELIEFNSKLYGIGSGILLEWNGVDAWVAKTAAASVTSLAVHGGEIYGGDYSGGRLYKWNGINAWLQVAPKYQDGIAKLISFGGTLYGLTSFVFLGTGGRLFNFTGAAWGVVAGKYSNERYGRVVVEHDSKIFAGTGGTEGALLEWDGIGAWIMRAQADPLGGGGEIYGLTTLDGEIYALHSGPGLVSSWLSKWDGVSDFEWQADDPTSPVDSFPYQIIGWNGSIFGMGSQGYLWKFTP